MEKETAQGFGSGKNGLRRCWSQTTNGVLAGEVDGTGFGGAARPTWGWILNHRSAQAPNGGPPFVGLHAR